MNFVAIDFETATGSRASACAVGIVMVKEGLIVHEFYSLIKPPGNEYNWRNIEVHGIKPEETLNAPTFEAIYPTLKRRLEGNVIVAHNEKFDRSVLQHSMAYYGLNYEELGLADKWECTLKRYKAKGYKPANLAACCGKHDIELIHHEALSDAVGCAKLYVLDEMPDKYIY